jgi:hypothetical protein
MEDVLDAWRFYTTERPTVYGAGLRATATTGDHVPDLVRDGYRGDLTHVVPALPSDGVPVALAGVSTNVENGESWNVVGVIELASSEAAFGVGSLAGDLGVRNLHLFVNTWDPWTDALLAVFTYSDEAGAMISPGGYLKQPFDLTWLASRPAPMRRAEEVL